MSDKKCCKGSCDNNADNTAETNNANNLSSQDFQNHLVERLFAIWRRAESAKNILRNGQQVIAYEQIQGVSDSIGNIAKLIESNINNNDSE